MTAQYRNKLLFIILIVLVIVWFSPTADMTGRMPAPVVYEKAQVVLPTSPPKTLAVDVASEQKSWQRGMMFRHEWGDIQGMLFVFPNEEPRSFWMQNTYLPLDIIYLDRDAKIVHIAHDAKPLDTTSIPSQKPAQMVLEIAAGAADQFGLKEGDVLAVEQ